MGSFSVYCGISKISITAGTECILLPLIKLEDNYDEQRYVPFTLPIHGEYNDYGGIENIQEDFFTKLIEEAYKCSIQDFCNIILNDYDDIEDEDNVEQLAEELKDVKYMWIHKDVYNFIAKEFRPITFRRAEQFDFGNPVILTKLGFQYAGENSDKRYNKTYKFENVILYSDGTWAHALNSKGQQEGIYSIKDLKKRLPNLDTSYFENKEQSDIFELFDVKKRFNELYYTLGFSRDLLFWKNIVKMSEEGKGEIDEIGLKYAKTHKMQDVYLQLFENNDFCQILADIRRMILNCRMFSTQFEEFIPYITPQCGEHSFHDQILQKFVVINKKHCKED